MATPDNRLAALRDRLASAAEHQPLARDANALSSLSLAALRRDLGAEPTPAAPIADIRMHGAGVQGHHVPVRRAAAILASIQEAIAAIGQALADEPTARGRVPDWIRAATELRLSPALSPGSVVFHLSGAPEETIGGEIPESIGTATLVDRSMQSLLELIEEGNADDIEASSLVSDLRLLGPRAAKHLNDLVERLVEDDVDLDLTWRDPSGARNDAELNRRAALALRDAIDRNREEVKPVTLRGILQTVSLIRKADLLSFEGKRYRLEVPDEWLVQLGKHFNREVEVRAEETIIWSTTTGKESRRYRLLAISPLTDEERTASPADTGSGEERYPTVSPF